MQCVPVLDLRQDVVVHAVRGARDHYQPLRTPLADSAEPSDILAGLLGLFAFRSCYIADLDALQARGCNDDRIGQLARQYPALEFWVDAAFGERTVMPHYVALPNVRCVVGSESLATLAAWHATRARCAGYRPPVLSLDHAKGALLGPPALANAVDIWPDTVVAMNLDRVGSGEGPDLGLLGALRRQAPGCHLVAAGGVRDGTDLDNLAAAGVSAVLLATALHDGRVDAHSLARVSVAHHPDP